jgi:hypothetical protein
MMIINHVFIGRGPIKPADLFNILTWVSIGATINIYVANPDKGIDEKQHDFKSLFDVKGVVGNVTIAYDTHHYFSKYTLFEDQARGLADHVNIISLPKILKAHDELETEALRDFTVGWKNGILKFLVCMSDWWPEGQWNEEILQRVFTLVDATKFYLAATKQGLVCDMKVAPTKYFFLYEEVVNTQFISFQRGSAAAAGFENQLSGSMCEEIKARTIYAESGSKFGAGFGGKSVEDNARAFEKITAAHGMAMQRLCKFGLGVDTNKIPGAAKPVIDPEPAGWSGPVRVFKHPKDQSWAGRTLHANQKARAKRDIDDMAQEVCQMVLGGKAPFNKRSFGGDLFNMMDTLRNLSFFNIYS